MLQNRMENIDLLNMGHSLDMRRQVLQGMLELMASRSGFGTALVDVGGDGKSIEDQLDALHKARSGDDSQLQIIEKQIQRIKEKFPKGKKCNPQGCE